jgi:hypothetical protein
MSLPVSGTEEESYLFHSLQDGKSRLSLITGQPLGGSSLASGQMEVMLDRRLAQDDNRGLFQGVLDNKVRKTHD